MPLRPLLEDPIWRQRVLGALIVGLLVAAEMTHRTLFHRRAPSPKETAVNASIFGVDLLLRGAGLSTRLFVFHSAARFVPHQTLPSFASLAGCYVLVDFIYYWKHRLFHQTRLGWALHSTHHSSRELNFLSTFRLNWFEAALSYFFFLPLIVTGLPPLVLFTLIEINDGWQFVCHTRLVNKITWLDRFLNTPNIHRVHHHRSRDMADRNYGSTLMVWDRLFGTYHPGLQNAVYGIDGDDRSFNVFAIQFAGLRRLLGRSDTARTATTTKQ